MVPLLKAMRMPRVNLLLTDDVGLGKTVEAGLIISELILQRRIQRVLIITPASLRYQWHHELRQKFCLHFEVVDRDQTTQLRRRVGLDANPWRAWQSVEGIVGLGKVLELLFSAAMTLRQPYADAFFARNFAKRVTKLEDWETAMNVLGDTGPARLRRKSADEAKRETAEIEDLLSSADTREPKKFEALWSIIRTAVENPPKN